MEPTLPHPWYENLPACYSSTLWWRISTLFFRYIDVYSVPSTQSIWLHLLLYPDFYCGYNSTSRISCVRESPRKCSLFCDTACFRILLHLNGVWLFNILQRYPILHFIPTLYQQVPYLGILLPGISLRLIIYKGFL